MKHSIQFLRSLKIVARRAGIDAAFFQEGEDAAVSDCVLVAPLVVVDQDDRAPRLGPGKKVLCGLADLAHPVCGRLGSGWRSGEALRLQFEQCLTKLVRGDKELLLFALDLLRQAKSDALQATLCVQARVIMDPNVWRSWPGPGLAPINTDDVLGNRGQLLQQTQHHLSRMMQEYLHGDDRVIAGAGERQTRVKVML